MQIETLSFPMTYFSGLDRGHRIISRDLSESFSRMIIQNSSSMLQLRGSKVFFSGDRTRSSSDLGGHELSYKLGHYLISARYPRSPIMVQHKSKATVSKDTPSPSDSSIPTKPVMPKLAPAASVLEKL
jgi:hypothetical protein